MAKDKEKQMNPATAALKANKNRAIKKNKAEQQQKRNDRLAQINPAHLQRKIADLRAVEESGGSLKGHEKQRLEELEKQLRGVEKARGVLGDKAPQFGRGSRRDGGDGEKREGGGVLGKRRREFVDDDGKRGDFRGRRDDRRSDSSETDEDVQDIPMPKDVENMPPIPRRRFDRRNRQPQASSQDDAQQPDLSLPSKPVTAPIAESKQVYSSAPVLRNLQQESTSRFVPAAVSQRLKAQKAEGGSAAAAAVAAVGTPTVSAAMRDAKGAAEEAEKEAQHRIALQQTGGPETELDLDEEARKYEEELKAVENEDVATTRDAALHDAEKIADEMEKEVEFGLMADAVVKTGSEDRLGSAKEQANATAKRLGLVEMEEVSDEDL